jgi:hypothetical protein
MSLLFLVLIYLSFYIKNFKSIFILAFAFGLLSDLVLANLAGFASLQFLGFAFLIYLYRRKFSSGHFIFQYIFVVLSDLAYSVINSQAWHYQNAIVLFFLTLTVYFIALRIKPKSAGLELEV